jgi:putative inorganic carbon (HCO3(-)) transporter
VESFRLNRSLILAGILFAIFAVYFIWEEQMIMFALPVALLAIYFAIFQTEKLFLSIFFFTPLSFNIEQFTDGFGLFVPTEPLLFGLMLFLLMKQIRKPIFPTFLWKNELVWAIGLYLLWIFVTAVTSELPLVSFKFLLVKLWFIIPVLFYGSSVFLKEANIRSFLWLFIVGMIIAMVYTITIHATYNFGEKESHWVMWPFFKDHTVYGAMVAFVIPLLIGLYFSKKHGLLVQVILIAFIVINFIALYFSYTRAAWLSVIAAVFVWGFIHFKIKFSWLLSIAAVVGIFVFFSWTSIEQSLAKNKNEHTTENFEKRIQSAANVTTDASNLERINRWTCAIDMFKERPWTGFGAGTYAFEYARFQRPENLTIISTTNGDGGNAHSEYLGAMAEMGIFGLITILLLVYAIFYKGIKLYHAWPKEDTEFKILILAMILALVTYFVHGTLNNYLDTDKASVPIWAISAIFVALEFRLKNKKESEKQMLTVN